MDNFKYMYEEYGYKEMYSAGFHCFDSDEEYYGYWCKHIYLNRYQPSALPLYKRLFDLVKDKNYFVITTNVDHQFQKAGFDKNRLFYTQGDYGLFQCSKACHKKTYDNEKEILNMIDNIDENHKIPTSLLPRCPKCGSLMMPSLRCGDLFVEDEGWVTASKNYMKFINDNKNNKILFLELGVGMNTPVIIKYPFIRMTKEFNNAFYVSINKNEYDNYDSLNNSLVIADDINNII